MAGQNATSALADVLGRTRPWADRRATERELTVWWSDYYGPMLGGERGPWDVADVLHELGQPDNGNPLPADVTQMVALMLGNVAAGRAPDDYGVLGTVRGIPARTMRRYRREPGPLGPLRAVLQRLNREQDLLALVNGGRTLPAARRWLERNPGKHAAEAPPPRKRRSL